MSTANIRTQTPVVPWWLVLVEGIAALIVGILLITVPARSVLISGVLGIAAGFVIIQHPLWSTIIIPTMLILVIAALGVITGISLLPLAFRGGGWGTGILGVLSVILSVVLFFNPFIAVVALPLVLGAFAIVGGISAIVSSFSLRRAPAMQARGAS
jgi:uncharacterized membrane protein HdeD (DUF308 family)